jgi:hypothetical protein
MKYVLPLVFLAIGIVIGHFLPTDQSRFNDASVEAQLKDDFIDAPKKSALPQFDNCSQCVAKLELLTAEVNKRDSDKELFSKAFKLFLLRIGVELSSTQASEFKSAMAMPHHYIVKNGSKGQTNAPDGPEVVLNDDFKLHSDILGQAGAKKWAVDHIEDKNLVKSADKFTLKDPAVFFARSKYIQKFSSLGSINGYFVGTLYHFAGGRSGQTHDVEMRVEFKLEGNDKIEGSFSLKLSHEGAVYSNSRGNGGNGNVRSKDDSVLIEAGPGRFFHFRSNELVVANFYQDGVHVGVAQFERVNK